jgi:DNA-binding MarR family transcriptional regulator
MDMTQTITEPLIALDSVMRAARIFAGITAESVAQTGDAVTLPQLRVLVLASTRPALNNTEVADALDVHLSNASRTCDRLVQAGLLSRRESSTDRRRVELSLTREGEKLLATITAHRQAAFSRILQQMPPQDQLALAHALDSFTDLADEHIERRYTQL